MDLCDVKSSRWAGKNRHSFSCGVVDFDSLVSPLPPPDFRRACILSPPTLQKDLEMSGCGYGLYPAGQPGSSSSDDEPRSVFAPLAAATPVQGGPLVTPSSVVRQPAPPPMKRHGVMFMGVEL